MNPEDIDDLFRQKLAGHASPPSNDLWARLHLPGPLPEAEAEPLDALFRAGLHGHATPPRRELWERLEDEHLRPQPRRRRAAAWWQYSAAAVLLLLLLAGGAELWRGSLGPRNGGLATTRPQDGAAAQPHSAPAAPSSPALANHDHAGTTLGGSPAAHALAQVAIRASKKNQHFFSAQATAPRASTSSTPMATTTRPRRAAAAARAAGSHRQQPDAAAGQLATGQRRPASQFRTTPSALDNQPTAPTTHAPTLAVASPTTAAPEIIEVDVRRGLAPTPAAAPVAVAAADAPPTAPRRRLRLGGLLRQADHLVHGESVSLAEATSVSETVTLQARLGGRLVSKTIRL